jgi:arginase
MSLFRRSITVIDAPSNLGLRPLRPGHIPGVYKLPDALRAQDIVARLGAVDAGRVTPPPYSPEPDPQTGFRNGTSIRSFALSLADRVAATLRDGAFPLVLGGDCSILIGNMLALKTLGRYGLFFLDGHDDFSYPRKPEKYAGLFAAGGLDLALVTGHGPDALTNIRGMKPYVRESDVAVFGYYHDPADAEDYATESLHASGMALFDIDRVRQIGAGQAAQAAVSALIRTGIEGFWVHLDADVLDQAVMPAVDSPNPKGLRYDELTDILRVLLGSGQASGMEITIFDPELDADGSIAAAFTTAVVEAFSGSFIGSSST